MREGLPTPAANDIFSPAYDETAAGCRRRPAPPPAGPPAPWHLKHCSSVTVLDHCSRSSARTSSPQSLAAPMDGTPAILTTLPPLHVPAAMASTVEGTVPPMASASSKKRHSHVMTSSQPAEAGAQSLLVRQNYSCCSAFGKICLNTVMHFNTNSIVNCATGGCGSLTATQVGPRTN